MRRASILVLCAAVILFAGVPVTAGETHFVGEVYGDYEFHLNDHGMRKNYSAFGVNRAYIGAYHHFNEKYSGVVVADIYPNGDDSYGSDASNSLDYRLRKAYLEIGNLIPNVDLQFGLHDVLWVKKVNSTWSLRYVDAASLDKLHYLHTADFGFSLIGHCPGDWGVLALQVFNGGGYKEAEMNKYKDLVFYGAITPFSKNPDFGGLTLMGQYYKGWPNIHDVPGTSDNVKMDRLQGGVIVTYREWFSFFGEVFQIKEDMDPYDITETTIVGTVLPEEDEHFGFSAFTKVSIATSDRFLSDIYLFAKYEYIDKHRGHEGEELVLEADEDDTKHILIGLGYNLAKGVDISVNFRRSTVNEMDFNEDNEPIAILEDERNSLNVNFLVYFN